MRDYRNYRVEDPAARKILDRPRWQEWIEFECELLNLHSFRHGAAKSDWRLEDFKPDALEWQYYEDAVLKGGHEITEMVSRMAEILPKEYHRHLHADLTSSNVIDSCNHRRWEKLLAIHNRLSSCLLKSLTEELPQLRVPGCTHGRLAHCTTVWHRSTAGYPADSAVPLHRLRDTVIGGPTGFPESNHRQAVPRYTYWPVWCYLAQFSAWVEQLANDYRFYCSDLATPLGVRGELGGRAVGSSSMPGKANPTAFERVMSVGHLIRSTVCTQVMLPPQWLDRDLVHSACERQTFDRLWDWSLWQLEEMHGLVKEVPLTAKSGLVTGLDSFTKMRELLDQGCDWHAARAEAGKHPTG